MSDLTLQFENRLIQARTLRDCNKALVDYIQKLNKKLGTKNKYQSLNKATELKLLTFCPLLTMTVLASYHDRYNVLNLSTYLVDIT